MRSRNTTQNTFQKSALYAVVFDTLAIRYVAALVFIFFVVHPAVPAFAAEDVPVAGAEISTPTPVPEAVSEQSPVNSTDADPSQENTVTEDLVPEAPVPEDAVVGTNENAVQDSATLQVVTQTETTTSDSKEVTDETSATISEDSEEVAGLPSSEVTTDENILIDLENSSSSTVDIQVVDTPDIDSDTTVESQATSTDLTGLSVQLASSTEVVAGGVDPVATISSSTQVTSGDSGVVAESGMDPSSHNEDDPKPTTTAPEDEEVDTTGTTQEVPNDESVETGESAEVTPETATTTDDSGETSTSTIPAEVPDISQINTVTNNLNAYQFADKECISVGDGSFYCSAIDGAPEYVEDGVFSAPDADGDTEIYVTINGETTQITNNLTDDASPYYDGISNTIVWHSMKNDRFQIAQYDVDTGDITYLTNTSYNNMEPVAYGSLILWQAWIGDNWEIMMLNNGELSQLTNNSMHDITPQIRDGYIMWQTQFSEGWKIALYDTKTKKVSYIADSDGSEVTNPRFVLVYDSTDKIGDVQTLGYDFGSGASFVLGNLPAEIPEKIPKPDQTGETRALIQAKPTPRENEITEVVPTSSGTGSSTPPTDVTASSTVSVQEGDLVIQPIATSSTSAVLQHASTTTPTITPEVDTVDMQVQATSTDTTHIQDVVIPPFSASSTQEVG